MIFYFTGTGNCLAVARELAAASGDMALNIATEMRYGGSPAYMDDAIGIVYPIYGHEMPHMVKQFLARATFTAPYFYLVATYGNRHANAVELAQRECTRCGIEPAYIATLLMVDNWLPNFDMNDQVARIPEKHIPENIARIKADIAARKRWIEPVSDADRAAHAQFLTRGIKFEPQDLEEFLGFDANACNGCGICQRICPADCISMVDKAALGLAEATNDPNERPYRAVRHATGGFGCNACLACIHACPHHAIHLPMGEVNPNARYRNADVKLSDLMM